MAVPSHSTSLGLFRQYTASTIAALSMLMIGMGTAWPSPVLPMIHNNTAPVHMDHVQISWMVSLLFLGNTISPIPVGYLMDIIGRKKALLILNFLPFISWIMIWYATYPAVLYIARFLNGLSAGAAYTIVAIYIGEIAEPSIRGALSNFNNLFRSIGGLFVFVVGPYISYSWLAIVCMSVPTIFFIAGVFLPESPYLLLMKKKKSEAKEALRWLRGNKTETALELELAKMEKSINEQMENKGRFKDIFINPVNRKAFLIACLSAAIKILSGFDVMMAYTSTTLPPKAFKVLDPNECVIILGVISVLTSVFAIFIIDRFSRRSLLTLSSIVCGSTTLIAGLWFFMDGNTDVDVDQYSTVPFYCFVVHAISYSIGLGPIVASIKGELFSASIKGLCSALITVIYAIFSFVLNKTYLIFADQFGMYVNYWIYAFSCFFGMVLILLYMVETRGKTLQEIQDKLSERKKNTNVMYSIKS